MKRGGASQPLQIRVHVKAVGHSILNDALYGGVLGASDTVVGAAKFSAVNVAAERKAAEEAAAAGTGPTGEAQAVGGLMRFRPAAEHIAAEQLDSRLYHAWEGEQDSMCGNCPFIPAKGYNIDDLAPLFLHAADYSCKSQGWSFSCPEPDWAAPELDLEALASSYGACKVG